MIRPENGEFAPLLKDLQQFKLRDGLQLKLCHFLPAQNTHSNQQALILVHGFAEHMGRYEDVAQLLSNIGFDVWAFDARGHGLSEGRCGAMPSDEALMDDLTEVFNHIARLTGASPVVVAHSMGGLVAALAVASQKIKPAALVLSSPALRVKMSFSQSLLLKIGLMAFKDTPFKAGAVDPNVLSHNPAVGVAYMQDKLVHRQISPRMAHFIRHGGERLMNGLADFGVPTLLMYGGDDRIVDASGSDDLAECCKKMDVKKYDGAFHEIFNESEPMRSVILTDLTDWLKKREFMRKFP